MYCASSGGEFPAALDAKAASKYIVLLVERNNADQVQRSQDQLGQDLLRLQRGFTFATALASDAKWNAHYVGAGVKLDTPARPIFWYKPANSETYRVIYADLSVRNADAAPDVGDPDAAPGEVGPPVTPAVPIRK
jgi:hypothetical protein